MVKDRTNIFLLENPKNTTNTSIRKTRQREVNQAVFPIKWQGCYRTMAGQSGHIMIPNCIS